MARIDVFYTIHKPKQHSAHNLDRSVIVEAQPTEIELVRKLGFLGVDLKSFEYFNNRGDEKFLAVNWRRKK